MARCATPDVGHPIYHRDIEIHDLIDNENRFQATFLVLDPIELRNPVWNPYGMPTEFKKLQTFRWACNP
jgi:hypothetical protein